VYVSREKSPKHHHNFKAGAMNVLVSTLLYSIHSAPIGVSHKQHREKFRGVVLIIKLTISWRRQGCQV
jgi:hypothetical protein